MSGLGIDVLPPGKYDGVVERIRYKFGAATKIAITYKIDTPDGPRRLEEKILIDAPKSSVSYFYTTSGLGRVADILRINGLSLADVDGLRTLPGMLEGVRLGVTEKQANSRVRVPSDNSCGEAVTRQRKPSEFAEDPDPFVVVGLDTEWVYESVGRNWILSYQFALLNADSKAITKLIIYPKKGKRISIEYGLTKLMLKARAKCVIAKVPNRFVISGHFTRADLTTFSDFRMFKRRLGAVRKTYATTEMPLSLQLASNEGPVRCNAILIDTMLLAPAGTSLEALGKLLGVPKIELPEGYSKDRMDLFLCDHPDKFEEYALTDAVIPALWVARIYGLLLNRLGIKKKIVTLGGAAVEMVKTQAKACDIELHDFIGRDKKKKQPLDSLMLTVAITAQSYHGGYNLAASLGFSPTGKELSDLDIKAAYTTALAFIGVPDWSSARHCADLKQLAVVSEAITAAYVEFRFPDDTRFPCLPIRAKNGRGLVYPLEGASWCTGPELVVAAGQGAIIKVGDGYRVDWVRDSIRLFEDITRRIGKIRAEAKTEVPPDVVLDKLVKEVGNSVYGKIAQAVASTRVIKDDIEWRRVFNTVFSESDKMGPSAISNAPMAAYCTGLVRALLTEALARLPKGMWVGTATTDGMLIAGTLAEIDQSGPVAVAFRCARERITPDNDAIWEVKHEIPGALVTKTRGTYTVAPEGWKGSSVVLAKAGYMTPGEAWGLPEIEQCPIWIEEYRNRNYETKMESKSLTSLRHQHLFEEDIQMVKRKIRWNADYDMKRKLVNVRDVDGLITADTVPWRTIDEFEEARDLLEEWKRSQRRVLKTAQDYDDMIAWGRTRANRRRIGTRFDNKLPPLAAAVLKVLARREEPLSEWFQTETYAQKAQWMSAMCGVKITETDIKNARRRGASLSELTGSITELEDNDRRFLMNWFGFSGIVPEATDIIWKLCAPESAAEAELDDLLWDAGKDQEAAEACEPAT